MKRLAMIALSVFSFNAYAACEREDVDHYLSQGFTPTQITALCSPAPAAGDQAVSTLTTPADPNVELLQEAIEGYNISVNEGVLAYTVDECVEYGRPNYSGFKPRVCGEVDYVLALAGLEVQGSKIKLLLWGDKAVKVKGDIQRAWRLDLSNAPKNDLEKIERAKETGDTTSIPVRSGIPTDRVQNALRQLSQ